MVLLLVLRYKMYLPQYKTNTINFTLHIFPFLRMSNKTHFTNYSRLSPRNSMASTTTKECRRVIFATPSRQVHLPTVYDYYREKASVRQLTTGIKALYPCSDTLQPTTTFAPADCRKSAVCLKFKHSNDWGSRTSANERTREVTDMVLCPYCQIFQFSTENDGRSVTLIVFFKLIKYLAINNI